MIHIGGREVGESGGDSPGEEERQVIYSGSMVEGSTTWSARDRQGDDRPIRRIPPVWMREVAGAGVNGLV